MARCARALVVLFVALAGCNGLLGIKEGEPLEDAALIADTGDTGAEDTNTADTADTSTADTSTADTADTSTVDTSIADTSTVDTSDAGCSELTAYPPAKGCPDFAWACWPIAPDSPGAANYTVKAICGDKVVIDKTTGLMWAQDEEPGTFNVAQAKARCAGSKRAGFSDWRLPSRIELTSLVDRSRATAPTIEVTAFPSASGGAFWSSSVYAPSTNNVWYVGFTRGYTYYTAETIAYGARCVR